MGIDVEGPTICIDLGTSKTCIAVFREGQEVLVPNDHGNKTTPSYVSLSDADSPLVGESALQASNPNNSIFDVKRLIGRKFSDSSVKNDMTLWPFKVACGAYDKPMIKVSLGGEEKDFSAEEISSWILAGIKKSAEKFLATTVRNAVITVPAYFNDSQRAATMVAGAMSGLNITRLINDSTAAAIAYGFHGFYYVGERNVLIFDLGGGCFDVSILTIKDNKFVVKSTTGDTQLGGIDFDNRMMTEMVKEIKTDHNIDITGNARALRKLRTACESAKRSLSSASQTMIEIESLVEGFDLRKEITRERFEELNIDLFRKCIEQVERCLRYARMDKTSVDNVVLVGGSTRIPKVQQLLQDFFNGKELDRHIQFDEAIAYGAALLAADLPGVMISDVMPMYLGLESPQGVQNIIFPGNTKIPVTKEVMVSAGSDGLDRIYIAVYEQDRSRADRRYVGCYWINDIEGAQSGVPQFKIRFYVDPNGMLNLSIQDMTVREQNSNSITVLPTHRHRLSRTPGLDSLEVLPSIERRYAILMQNAELSKERVDKLNKVKSMVDQIETVISDEGDRISDADIEFVEWGLGEAYQLLVENYETASFEDIDKMYDDVKTMHDAIYEKMIQY